MARKSILAHEQPSDNGKSEGHFPGPEELAGEAGPAPAASPAQPAAGPDPFDLDALRKEAGPGVVAEAVVATVAVRKPGKSEFIRVHPAPEYATLARVIDLKEGEYQGVWLVAPGMGRYVADEATCSPRQLVTAVTRDGDLFIWPLRIPGHDGRLDDWGRAHLRAADLAKTNWVRVSTPPGARSYKVEVAKGDLGDPAWPTEPFGQLLRMAFAQSVIDRPDHPVLRRLRGEA